MKLIIDIPDEMYDCIKKDTESEMYIIDVIKRSIPYEERPQGEWKHEVIGDKLCVLCNQCFLHFDCESNFCPNCGADMQKGD